MAKIEEFSAKIHPHFLSCETLRWPYNGVWSVQRLVKQFSLLLKCMKTYNLSLSKEYIQIQRRFRFVSPCSANISERKLLRHSYAQCPFLLTLFRKCTFQKEKKKKYIFYNKYIQENYWNICRKIIEAFLCSALSARLVSQGKPEA